MHTTSNTDKILSYCMSVLESKEIIDSGEDYEHEAIEILKKEKIIYIFQNPIGVVVNPEYSEDSTSSMIKTVYSPLFKFTHLGEAWSAAMHKPLESMLVIKNLIDIVKKYEKI